MFKIMADEQGWLDTFNRMYVVDYKQGDTVDEDEIIKIDQFGEYELGAEINNFNNTVARGEAIWLEKVGESE